MSLAANAVIALIGLLHVYILVLEMFLWDKPAGRRVELKIQYSCIKATPHNSGPT